MTRDVVLEHQTLLLRAARAELRVVLDDPAFHSLPSRHRQQLRQMWVALDVMVNDLLEAQP